MIVPASLPEPAYSDCVSARARERAAGGVVGVAITEEACDAPPEAVLPSPSALARRTE